MIASAVLQLWSTIASSGSSECRPIGLGKFEQVIKMVGKAGASLCLQPLPLRLRAVGDMDDLARRHSSAFEAKAAKA
jgi:hypothetical protein